MKIQNTILLTLLGASALLGQVTSVSNPSITGKYNFLYAVWQRDQSGTVMGSVQFDGSGGYSLQGQWQAGSGVARSVTAQGTYRVLSDATGQISNPLDPLLPPLSLRLGADAATVSGSTLELSSVQQHDLLIALKAFPASRSVADLSGAWVGVHNRYLPGPPPVARAGRFRFQFDGQGRTSSTEWTFHQSDQSNGAAQTATSSGGYTLAADGTGTFETAQGRKRYALSADANILIGTDDASGQELIFALRATSNTDQGPTGRFYWEQLVAVAPGGADPRASAFSWALTNDLGEIDGVGLPRASGSQWFADGPTGRLLDMAAMLGPFAIAPTGYVDLGFGGLASAGIGGISPGPAQYMAWTNLTSAVTGTYSFNILLPAPAFAKPQAQTVWLDPVGARQEAGRQTSPAPAAPGALMSVRGAGLADSVSAAPSFPLPTSLGGTQLTANGQPVPLYDVAPDHITFILPNSTAGAGRIELQATAKGGPSNAIQIRSVPALPAFFSQSRNGLGSILAQHADGSAITSAAPAARNEVVTLFATGLGQVTNGTADGTPSTGPAPVTIPVLVDFGGVFGDVLYAGVAPGYPGLYQVNVRLPAGAASSSAVNVRIQQGYTQSHNKVTIAIN